jgi:hypothetical protein
MEAMASRKFYPITNKENLGAGIISTADRHIIKELEIMTSSP